MIEMGCRYDEMFHPTFGDKRARLHFYEELSSMDEKAELAMQNRRITEALRMCFLAISRPVLTPYKTETWHLQGKIQYDAYWQGEPVAQYGDASASYRHLEHDLSKAILPEVIKGFKDAFKGRSDHEQLAHYSLGLDRRDLNELVLS